MGKDSPKDLKVRTMSALVMIAVAGSALWAGGWVFTVFVMLIAAGLLWEWWGLISRFNAGALGRVLWMLGGVVYIGGASLNLTFEDLRFGNTQNYVLYSARVMELLALIGAVVISDVGAYLTGRFIGGPKVAPLISPNKTWAGLVGAIVGASLWFTAFDLSEEEGTVPLPLVLIIGGCIGLIAQLGDFFESWLKRRAGVKDSGALIPAHGGLLDRLDGLVAVLFAVGFVTVWARAFLR
jgi:phosphatidate cytidylyltransferase